MKKAIKQSIKKFDMFSHNVTFRYNQQPQYQTLTGGCISVILIGVFFGVFLTTFFNTFQKTIINSTVTQSVDQNPVFLSASLNKIFMFAVGVTTIDMNTGNRYFDISIVETTVINGTKTKTTIPLYPCSQSVWAKLGFGQTYNRLGFSKWLCPSQNMTIKLQGKYTSDTFAYYKMTLNVCKPTLDLSRPCEPNSTILTFLAANQNYNFNFYFINTLLNPSDQNYLSTYLEDINYFPFSFTAGINANLFVSSYSIQTDQSLFPIQDMLQQNGGIINTVAQTFNYQVTNDPSLVRLYLRKSSTNINIQRSFQRFDDTLSYIGGLFSAILGALLIVGMYNQLSFQLDITKDVYYFQKNTPINSDDFNFLTFLGYLIYMMFDKFNIHLPWPMMHRYHQYMESARLHMDMRLIMKKIIYSERVADVLLEKHQAKALHLQEPMTLQQAQVIRKDFRFYKNFKKKYFPKNETHDENELSLYLTGLVNKKQLSSSELIRTQGKNKQMKIFPIDEDSFCRQNTFVNGDQNGVNLDQTMMTSHNGLFNLNQNQIKRQEQFKQMNAQMKIYMLQLRADSQRGDPVAKKVFQQIDPRVKAKYFKSSQQRKLNNSKVSLGSILQNSSKKQ